MNKKLFLLIINIVPFFFSTHAQVAMGKWRTHFAYNTINQISQSENKIFAVSNGALFSVDKRDGNMEFFSKVSGLNGAVISKIKYDDGNKILLIIYDDGNIDFLSVNGVKNLPDLYNKQMSANKSVNNILFYNNKAFLSCKFGIVTLNILKMEVQDTYYIGDNASEIEILNTTLHNNNIYAVSASNIYYAAINNPQLINYQSWSKMSSLPGSGNYQALYSFSNNLVLLRGGKLYKQSADGTWGNLDISTTYTAIIVSGDYLQAYTATNCYIFDKQFVKSQITGLTNIKDGLYDNAASKFWFACNDQGIAEYKQSGATPITKFYKPNGPDVNIPYKLRFADNKLFVLQGGRWGVQYNRPGMVMIYENNQWKNITNASIAQQTNHKVYDFMDIAVDPNDNKHFLISSYGTGVYEFKNETFYKWYNFTNSSIETIFPTNPVSSYEYMRMTSGIFDNQGNVWFANSGVSSCLKVMRKDETWFKLAYDNIANMTTLGDVIINNQNNNQKWIFSVRATPGIGIIDDNGTADDKSDDKSIFLSSFINKDTDKGGLITPLFYFSAAQDKNGVMWVGTDEGPLLFNNTSKAFDNGYTCSRVIIPRNDGTGLGDLLLADQHITAIAVDGANRKWLGTETSGVYLMSENGQQTIQHFTTLNSPLLSNNILSIAINPVTGEVFFGTGGGLVSYQSDAADGGATFNNVHVYPNPVRENFTGIITITGLVDKTNVKITDISGNLVNETTSNGSIATWNGKNKYGQKVSTGVYLAICVSQDGTQSTTTKILVIN